MLLDVESDVGRGCRVVRAPTADHVYATGQLRDASRVIPRRLRPGATVRCSTATAIRFRRVVEHHDVRSGVQRCEHLQGLDFRSRCDSSAARSCRRARWKAHAARGHDGVVLINPRSPSCRDGCERRRSAPRSVRERSPGVVLRVSTMRVSAAAGSASTKRRVRVAYHHALREIQRSALGRSQRAR